MRISSLLICEIKLLHPYIQQIRNIQNVNKQVKNESFAPHYCADLVRKHDRENYLCTLLLNSHFRRYAFALRAFNVEVAKCSMNINENIGKMRLRFWYDSIDKCYDMKGNSYAADHPVLYELKNILYKQKISKMYLKRLVTARDRGQHHFLTITELEEYAELTCSSLFYLLIELSGIKNIQVDHAASHLGKAQGITNLLRTITHTECTHFLHVPLDILIKNGVSQERIVRNNINDKDVKDCIFEVASIAHQHLDMARNLSGEVPNEIKKLFLPAIGIARFLERLRKSEFRINNCLERDHMLPMSLYWNSFRNKY